MDSDDRDETRLRFPFEGLHVYQRTQEAWTIARETVPPDPLGEAVEDEVGRAALGIARATAKNRANGNFAAELERARAAIHAAAALVEQLERRGTPADETLRELLVDSGRMLGALVRSVTNGCHVPVPEEVAPTT